MNLSEFPFMRYSTVTRVLSRSSIEYDITLRIKEANITGKGEYTNRRSIISADP